MNGGLDINLVKQCIESCNSCSSHGTKRKMQVWHEKHFCRIDEVESKLDDIKKVHIVVRTTRIKTFVGFNQVTYFNCHKDRKKGRKKNPSGKKDAQCSINARRERIFKLCGCEFRIKTIVPLPCGKKKMKNPHRKLLYWFIKSIQDMIQDPIITYIFYQFIIWWQKGQCRI